MRSWSSASVRRSFFIPPVPLRSPRTAGVLGSFGVASSVPLLAVVLWASDVLVSLVGGAALPRPRPDPRGPRGAPLVSE